MAQKDKDLLLRDLCARLPYRVLVHHPDYNEPECLDTVFTPDAWNEGGIMCTIDDHWDSPHDIRRCKPYLRPMSSMTEKEREEYEKTLEIEYQDVLPGPIYHKTLDSYYYLLEHHFDFRGLITAGCAIEVTEENNPYKD